MHIRRARPSDLASLVAIEEASFSLPWPADLLRAYFDDPRAVMLVAEEIEPIGFLIARDEHTTEGRRALHIHDLAVAPARRRQGVASALLASLARIAFAQGISTLQLEVRVENEGAQRFYERHGFQVTRRLVRYYEDGGAALRMELDLSPR